MLKYSNFSLQPLRNKRFKVLQEIRYKDIIVPKGYRTNGGNIPRLVWFFLTPFDPEMLPLYVVHDYLCDKEMYYKADEYLLEVGLDLNVNKYKLVLVYNAVRLYHKIKYKDYK